jgi:hypothetical protein
MRDDAEKAAQHQIRESVRLVAIDEPFEPFPKALVVRRILAVRVDQDIDINELRPPGP